MKPSIPKGTRDFSPSEMVRRNFIFNTIKKVYEGEKDEYLRGILKEGLGDLLN